MQITRILQRLLRSGPLGNSANRAMLWHALSLPLLALVLVLLVRWLPVAEYVTRAQRRLTELELWGGVLYPLLFAGCNLLLLPGGVLAIGAGLFFGLWWGWALNVLGSTLGAAAAVLIARQFGRRWVETRLNGSGKWKALDAAVAREGWKIIFLSQVHPLFPTSLLNYLYGLTRVPLRTCVLWIAVGQAPGMFLYAYLGRMAQSGLRVWRGAGNLSTFDWALWCGGLVLTVAMTTALARLALKLLAGISENGGRPRRPAPEPVEMLGGGPR
jgi:uncharacterized membrane protein YdjX (TVP38/TMEM64 family)